jgi:hypothetical protein
MWPMTMLMAVISLVGYAAISNQVREPIPGASSGDLAINMREYRLALQSYVAGHPSASGTVGDDKLQFPSWYTRNALWSNYVQSGTIVVYATKVPPQSITAEIVQMSGGSIFTGTADGTNHVLYSPAYGQTAIALSSVN